MTDVASLMLQMEANGQQVSLQRNILDNHFDDYLQLVQKFPHLRSSLDGERRRWESLFSSQYQQKYSYIPNKPNAELLSLVPEIDRRTFNMTPPRIHLP